MGHLESVRALLDHHFLDLAAAGASLTIVIHYVMLHRPL